MPAEPVDRVDQIPADVGGGDGDVPLPLALPWLADGRRGQVPDEVEKLAALGAEVIVGAHTPVISGSSIERAFELLAGLLGHPFRTEPVRLQARVSCSHGLSRS